MNREIKFRGKAEKTGEWVYGGYYCHSGYKEYQHYIVRSEPHTDLLTRIIPGTEGQFIGRKDKNGNEIFKGDIIQGFNGKDEFYGPVIWYQGNCSFVIDLKDENLHCSLFHKFELEILGNIHENPKLLEKKSV